MRKKIVISAVILVGLIALGIVAICFIDKSQYFLQKRVVVLLGIKQAPQSLDNVVCQDWGSSDVLVRCYFTVAPQDFPLLLKGYPYKERQLLASTETKNLKDGPQVGPSFRIFKEYVVSPSPAEQNGYKTFSSGGQIKLYTTEQMDQVFLDYYEE